MEEAGLATIAGILLITLNLQGDAGRTFVNNCSSYTVHELSPSGSSTWNVSGSSCKKENGSALVSIETREEQIFLEKELIKRHSTNEYFIGLKRKGGKWSWISGNGKMDPSHKLWGSHVSQKEDCAKMYFKGTDKVHIVYDDINCVTYALRGPLNGYICERPVDCQDGKGLEKRVETTTKPTTYLKSSAKKSATAHSISSVSQVSSRQPTASKTLFSSTSIIQDPSSSDLTTKVHSSETATPPEKSTTGNPIQSIAEESNSQLIAIALTALGVIILVILFLLWFFFVRRPRSKATDSKTPQDVFNPQQQSSSQTAIDPNLTPSEKGLDTFETINEDKEEHTYDDIDNSNRKQRSAENGNSSVHELEDGMQRQSKDEYRIPFDKVLMREAEKKPDTTEVYAIVHVHPDHGKAVFTKGCGTQRDSLDLTGSSQLPFEIENLRNNRNSSFSVPEHPKSVSQNVVAQSVGGENECHDYLYAVVDKANNKRKAAQMPAPYRNLVYADLSHSSQKKNGRINRASLPTVYAAIDYRKTGEIKSKLPEENMDQTVESMAHSSVSNTEY